MAEFTGAELKGFYSDIVLGKTDSSDQGYSFLEMGVVYAETLKAGMLVKIDGTPAAVADAASVYGVLLDRDLLNGVVPREAYVVGTTYKFVVGVRGLTLNKSRIVFSDGTTVINDTAIAALHDKGIKVTDHYFGAF